MAAATPVRAMTTTQKLIVSCCSSRSVIANAYENNISSRRYHVLSNVCARARARARLSITDKETARRLSLRIVTELSLYWLAQIHDYDT